MSADGTFLRYPALVDPLPPLVRQQRKLAAQIATVAQAVIDEKAIRADIDQLLVAAGLQKSEVVTCDGYDIRHNEKAGSARLNPDTLTTMLAADGWEADEIAELITAITDTGNPSLFATVTPTKGATVKPVLATAGLTRTRTGLKRKSA